MDIILNDHSFKKDNVDVGHFVISSSNRPSSLALAVLRLRVVIPKNRWSTTFSDVTILNFEAYRLYCMEFRTEDCYQLKKLIE